MLDADCDDKISFAKMNPERLDLPVFKAILPILDELQKLDGGEGEIDGEEFVNAGLRLYK